MFKPRVKHILTHPWILFFFFTSSSVFLSYGQGSVDLKLAVGIIGVACPLLSAFIFNSISSQNPFQNEFLPRIPRWAFLGAVIIVLTSKFIMLTSFFEYPFFDEILYAYYALRLEQHWSWNLFFHYSGIPPFYIWLLAILFNTFGFSTSVLWGLPAGLSTLSVFMFFAVARTFSSRSYSFAFFLLLGLNFWLAFVGRISLPGSLLIFVEGFTLYALSKALQSNSTKFRSYWAILSGIALGLGFYIYPSWLLFMAWGMVFLATAWLFNPNRKQYFFYCLFAVGATTMPLLLAGMKNGGYLPYIYDLFLFRWEKPVAGWEQSQMLYWFTTFFWSGWWKYFSYSPAWGGFLNPILDGLFFLGVVSFWEHRQHPIIRMIFLAFLFCFFPIIFTVIFEAYRLILLIPFFFIIIIVGFNKLSNALNIKKRTALFALLLACSIFLDFINLGFTRAAINQIPLNQKNETYVRASQILMKKGERDGPGCIFLGFTKDTWDLSLPVMTQPFNALFNSKLSPDMTSWAAIITEDFYQPSLSKIFPHAYWFVVGKDEHFSLRSVSVPAGVLLGIMPIDNENRPRLQAWAETDRHLREVIYQLHQFVPYPGTWEMVEIWLSVQDYFQADPFLKSWYWEKMAGFFIDFNQCNLALSACEKAISSGYVTGPLYQQYGFCLVKGHRYREAHDAFIKAGRTDSRFFPLQPVLQQLDRLEKNKIRSSK